MDDPFNLDRFLSAQSTVYEQVVDELRAGSKRSHWMWFIFPQMKGLGLSPQAIYYGIGSLEEATAYWKHKVLGPRLEECARLVNRIEGRTIHEIFGSPDDLKFRSSMTLFGTLLSRSDADSPVFYAALKKYFDGEPDPLTLAMTLLH